MNRIKLLILLLLPNWLSGQAPMIPDEDASLNLETYLDWVRSYHPIARQANLFKVQADAELMKARGGFDPKLYTDFQEKTFDGKDYFTVGEGGVKIPTWLGIDVKAAYNWTNGQFLNPENNLPSAGQAIAGVTVPLIQGLRFDDRRAQVQQARLVADLNEAERLIVMNKLLLAATEAYWNWAYAKQSVNIFENALQLAEQRLDLTNKSFIQGDKPAIDTLESFIQVQNRELDLAQANIELQNERANLSNFLWGESSVPMTLRQDVNPISLDVTPQLQWLNEVSALLQNPAAIPDLQTIAVKQAQLEIKERLKIEQLKPRLNVEYNFLADGFDFLNPPSDQENQFNALVTENYKWGVEFSFPLFLRKERASLELVRIDQVQNQLKFENKELSIQNKVAALRQEMNRTLEQIELAEIAIVSYRRLLEAENLKFRIGESSIFLLNSREQKLIEAQLKILKLQATYMKLEAKLKAAVGMLR